MDINRASFIIVAHMLFFRLLSATRIWISKFDSFVVIKKFRCYVAKIEESEKAGIRWESNPGHLWLEPPVLCH